MPEGSALGELEALTGTGLTGLFAFLHARVASEETEWLDDFAVFWINLSEAAGNRVADRDRLGVDAAAFDDHIHIELIDESGGLERCENCVLEFDGWKVIFEGARVDGDLAGAFGEPDAGNCGFASAGSAR